MRWIVPFRRRRNPRHIDTSALKGTTPAAPGAKEPDERGGWIKNHLEIIALVAAGLLTLYQWNAGYFSTDTSMELSAQRAHEADGDLVVVNTLLSRTRRRTEMTDLQCRVYCPSGHPVPCSFPALALRPTVDGVDASGTRVHSHRIVGWKHVETGGAFTSMSPGDHAQFAGVARGVPRGQACTVQVAVVMKKQGSLAWVFGGEDTNVRRSTLVSLPLDSIP